MDKLQEFLHSKAFQDNPFWRLTSQEPLSGETSDSAVFPVKATPAFKSNLVLSKEGNYVIKIYGNTLNTEREVGTLQHLWSTAPEEKLLDHHRR